MTEAKQRFRLGVDVGGTHTDLVLLTEDGSQMRVQKVSSTPKNPAIGVINGLRKFLEDGVAPEDISFFSHGTTITTNALLEMRGAKVGLLVNRGFRGIQEVQSQARDGNLFDYFFTKPEQIAPQHHTWEVTGRIDHTGHELAPLSEDNVRHAAREAMRAGIDSVAVCYLFSYLSPAHELRTREILQEEAPGLQVSLSCEVLPRVREWRRMSTTLLNAYLEPVLVRYIEHLNTGIGETGVTTQQRFLMQSNGGVMPFSAAIAGSKTVHTLFSGPAAGAQASAFLAAQSHSEGIVTLDMGGTSADIAFIEGGVPLEVTEGEIARRQLDVPALDMTTISAGGGSIAAVKASGFLTVGPQSAGADPGPACYGRGGTRPTVTDADMVCGYLNPDYFLGGSQSLDRDASARVIEDHIARPLGMGVLSAAAGIRRIVDMRMADEVRVFAAKRGVDLSRFTLLPFGGAGAVHAASVAEELGIKRIMVPPRPGAFSALGLLCTDVVHDYIRSELVPLEGIASDYVESVFAELESRAREDVRAEWLDPAAAHVMRELDLRYTGQGYELRIPIADASGPAVTAESLAATRALFDERHAQIHGHAAADRPVEIVSYRLRLRVDVPKYRATSAPPASGADTARCAEKGRREVHFDGATATEATLYERDKLEIGAVLSGPAIIEQFDSTTVIPPNWRATIDGYRNLVIEDDRT